MSQFLSFLLESFILYLNIHLAISTRRTFKIIQPRTSHIHDRGIGAILKRLRINGIDMVAIKIPRAIIMAVFSFLLENGL